jgi:hypothetical protein
MSLESRVGLGVKDGTIVSWCFEVLDSLLGYGNESELKYATGESYLNWKKGGLIPASLCILRASPSSQITVSADRNLVILCKHPTSLLSRFGTNVPPYKRRLNQFRIFLLAART